MRNPKVFHDRLAGRLAALFGATSLALVYAATGEACGKAPATTTHSTTTTGGGGADAGESSTTGFPIGDAPDADPLEVQCFQWPPQMTTSSSSGSSTAGAGGMTSSGSSTAASTSATTSAASSSSGMTMIDPKTGCPSDDLTILTLLDPFNCPNGWEARQVLSAPTLNAQNECCYQVSIHICLGGGRPYLVSDKGNGEEGAITAPAERGIAKGWSEGAAPNVRGLSREERAKLAAAWTKDALLEHASVASFARFSMALLAAGAPAELVEAAHRASLDEIRHARLCFALASGYAGEAVQPGAFPLGASLDIDGSLVGLARSTVIEGCIGETVAAIRASEQLARAEDPAVRHALAIIAEDEARHAELAWKTVLWTIKQGGAPVREAVREAFANALESRAALASSEAVEARLEAHGLLDDEQGQRITASALRDLVAPAARMLLATSESAAA
jgi:hypothetical protein